MDSAVLITLILSGVFLLAFFGIGSTVLWALFTGAPWVPTRQHEVERMARLVHANNNDVFYDLGCGDGRTIKAMLPYVTRAVGIEISLPNALWCYLRFRNNPRVHIVFNSFYRTSLHDATIVYIYQFPNVHEAIKEKLLHELPQGAHVVTHVWPILGWDDKLKEVSEEQGHPRFYIYQV